MVTLVWTAFSVCFHPLLRDAEDWGHWSKRKVNCESLVQE